MIAFDIESTGLDPMQDRIVELAMIDVETREVVFHEWVNPGMRIPASAVEVHGISNDDVNDCPRFGEYATEVQRIIEEEVLLGYGSWEFDSLMLDQELRRAGEKGIDFASLLEIDLLSLWRMMESRTLEGAVSRFLPGRDFTPHGAKDDAEVLPDLLEAMEREWGLDTDEILELSPSEGSLDRANNLRWDEDTREVVFNFGKYKGEPVREHPSYVEWMLNADFHPSTKRMIRRLQESDYRRPE